MNAGRGTSRTVAVGLLILASLPGCNSFARRHGLAEPDRRGTPVMVSSASPYFEMPIRAPAPPPGLVTQAVQAADAPEEGGQQQLVQASSQEPPPAAQTGAQEPPAAPAASEAPAGSSPVAIPAEPGQTVKVLSIEPLPSDPAAPAPAAATEASQPLPAGPFGEVVQAHRPALPPAAALPASTLPAQAAEEPQEPRSAFPRAEPEGGRRSFVDLTAAPCFGHAPDYSWISGQVEYSRVGKEWRLRYASVDEVDRYGGRVVLVESQHVGFMADGQYVRVRGRLVNPDSETGPASYRVESFQVINDPNAPPADRR